MFVASIDLASVSRLCRGADGDFGESGESGESGGAVAMPFERKGEPEFLAVEMVSHGL